MIICRPMINPDPRAPVPGTDHPDHDQRWLDHPDHGQRLPRARLRPLRRTPHVQLPPRHLGGGSAWGPPPHCPGGGPQVTGTPQRGYGGVLVSVAAMAAANGCRMSPEFLHLSTPHQEPSPHSHVPSAEDQGPPAERPPAEYPWPGAEGPEPVLGATEWPEASQKPPEPLPARSPGGGAEEPSDLHGPAREGRSAPFGDRKCGARWGGFAVEHCTGCHQTFAGTESGDSHRVGAHDVPGDRRCLSVEEMEAGGMWATPNPYGTRVWHGRVNRRGVQRRRSGFPGREGEGDG